MEKDFYGRGWEFPVSVDPVTGKIAMSEGEKDIRESIKIILNTSIGERVMNVKFGSSMRNFTFETIETGTLKLLEFKVKEALAKWENRIRDIVVYTQSDMEDEGVLNIYINYVVCATNMPENLVYPYYLNQG